MAPGSSPSPKHGYRATLGSSGSIRRPGACNLYSATTTTRWSTAHRRPNAWRRPQRRIPSWSSWASVKSKAAAFTWGSGSSTQRETPWRNGASSSPRMSSAPSSVKVMAAIFRSTQPSWAASVHCAAGSTCSRCRNTQCMRRTSRCMSPPGQAFLCTAVVPMHSAPKSTMPRAVSMQLKVSALSLHPAPRSPGRWCKRYAAMMRRNANCCSKAAVSRRFTPPMAS